MRKSILIILLLSTFGCGTEKVKNISNDVISKISMKVVKYNSEESILSIQTTLINSSDNNVYFFEPNLQVYDGTKSQSAYALSMNDYEKSKLLDSLIANNSSDITRLGTKLRENVKQYFSIKEENIYGSFVEKCVFLKKGESKILKEHLYFMTDKKLNGLYRFYLTNVSESENKKGYEIYKNLPESFEGYKFWKGKIKSDTLDFEIRDFNLPNKQVGIDLPPVL